MTEIETEIAEEDVQEWLRRDVGPEVEDLRAAEIDAPFAPDWYRGVLAWASKYYIDDELSLLHFPDGPGDGGIDIASVVSVAGQVTFHIFQLSTPRLETLAEGRLIRVRTKLGDDARRFRNEATGQTKRLRDLNYKAQEVLRLLYQARDLPTETGEAGAAIHIEIHPMTLKWAHPDARREISDLAEEASKAWVRKGETWLVRPLKDVFDLYREYQRRRPKAESPSELSLRFFGQPCRDHPERGPLLAFVAAGDVVAAYEKWGAGLLDANLRYSLGATPVNSIIEGSAQRPGAIKWFHERNNGVVIICSAFRVSGDRLRLQSPQIVNGGQTIHSIAEVLRRLEQTPTEVRTAEDEKLRHAIKNEMRLSARIVVTSGGGAARADEIALASNTQNKLSDRTMNSSSLEMRDLRRRLAALETPWFAITKDGEWDALQRNKPLFQSRTGNRQARDFLVSPGRYRQLENTNLGVALLAFWGFAAEAKPSRVFVPKYFARLFGQHVSAGSWQILARERPDWTGGTAAALFAPAQSPGSLLLLAYFAWLFWRGYTYPESRQLLMAYDEEGVRNPKFKELFWKNRGWDVPEDRRDELLKRSDSCYWTEQVAKSAYLVLVYQTMRLLVHAFGDLDGETCLRVLTIRQFAELNRGEPAAKLGDFRLGSLTDGPLTAIGRLLLYACSLLWTKYESQIRNMASRQQVLLQEEWIAKLSGMVDDVCARVGEARYRHAAALEGPNDRDREIADLRGLLCVN